MAYVLVVVCELTTSKQRERDNLRTMTPIVELTCWKLKGNEEKKVNSMRRESHSSAYLSSFDSRRADKSSRTPIQREQGRQGQRRE